MSVPARYPWRSRAETYASLPLFALVFADAGTAASSATPGYWTAAVAKADLLLFIVVPLCALCAAWEGSRHRRGRIRALAIVRPTWQVVLVAVVPTLIMGSIGLVEAVAVTAGPAMGAPGVPDGRLIVVYALVLVAHTLVGYAIGYWLPPAVALPASLGGSYVWLAYPAAIEPFWVRHLNGLSFESCCSVEQAPASRALLGSALFAVGIGGGVLLALSGGRTSRIGGTTVFAVLLMAAAAVVLPLGPSAGVPRTGVQRCAGAAPVLCLWPEQEAARDTIESALRTAYVHLHAIGVPLPATVTTREPAGHDRLFVVLPVRPDRSQVVSSLVSSLVPDTVPDCATRGDWPGASSRQTLTVWMTMAAGIPAAQMRDGNPSESGLAERVRRLTGPAQLAWYRANLPAMRDCTTAPRLDPAPFRPVAR